jgi:hypothetical protein
MEIAPRRCALHIGYQTATLEYWRYQSLYVAPRPNTVTCFSHTSDTVAVGAIDDGRVGFDVNCKPAGRIDLALQVSKFTITPDSLDWGSC